MIDWDDDNEDNECCIVNNTKQDLVLEMGGIPVPVAPDHAVYFSLPGEPFDIVISEPDDEPEELVH